MTTTMPGPSNIKKSKKNKSKINRKSNSLPASHNDVPQSTYIHDPGNGPRVRDTRAFLTSFFAQPPTLDDPLCAEFAQSEVCQMLCTVLPEETALVRPIAFTFIYWWNNTFDRYCGITKVVKQVGYVLPANVCID